MVNHVSIPEGLAWDCPSRQLTIRFQNDIVSFADLNDRLSAHHKRTKTPRRTELVLELPSPSMLKNFSNTRWFGPRIRVILSDHQMAEIHRNRSIFHAIHPTLVLNHCEGSLPRIIQFLASLNLPIEVDPTVFIDQDQKTLLDLADRLLFSPFVKTPVQPFFNMLLSAMGSKANFSTTLWDSCNESIGQNYFITSDGKITLSNRWAEINRFFGDISDTIYTVRTSPLFSELNSLRDSDPAENSKCYQCRVYSFCSRHLCAIDSTHDCSPFKSLYDFMSSHSKPLKESYFALPKQGKNDVFQAIQMPMVNRQP